MEALAAHLTVLDFDSAASGQAGEISAELEAIGSPIGPYDTLIAGHARSHGLIVVTGNLRVVGLRAGDWMAG